MVFSEQELKHLIETWGADRVMLGTDYPFDMAEPDPVGFLNRVKGVSGKDMALVAGGNAQRLLGIRPLRKTAAKKKPPKTTCPRPTALERQLVRALHRQRLALDQAQA